MFLNMDVLQGGVVRTSPNLQAGGPPLVGCPRLLIQFIGSYPPYRRPFNYLGYRVEIAVVDVVMLVLRKVIPGDFWICRWVEQHSLRTSGFQCEGSVSLEIR